MLTDFLAGTRVLDLSMYLPGPFATRLLADMGADVVKVEPPAGDPTGTLDLDGDDGWGDFYSLLNAGKTVVRLDLKTEADAEALSAMVRRADVLLESFRPGVLDRLGFGEARLKELNPGIVHCALSGFGQTGPNRLASGHDVNYEAMTGGLGVGGTPERPTIPYPPAADYAGAMQAVITILGALVAHNRRGTGAYLDVSLTESLLSWQGPSLSVPPPRAGGIINGGAAFYQLYETADGRFVSLSPIEPKFWANFCRAVGRDDWTRRQWEPMPQVPLIAEVAELFRTQPLAHWDAVLTPAECCYQAVLTYDEVAAHPHMVERGLLRRTDRGLDVLFPAYVDGRPPEPRKAIRRAEAAEILAAWAG